MVRRTVAATAAGAVADDLTRFELQRKLGPHLGARAAGVEQIAGPETREPAEEPVRPPAFPIRQNGERDLVVGE